MPASEARSGMGTYLRRNGIEIAEVYDIGGFDLSAESIDVTHLRSPDYWREKIPSLKDPGDLTFKCNFILGNPTHNAATGLLSGFAGSTAPPTDMWDLVFPEGTTWTNRGFIVGFKTGAVVDDKLQAEVKITLSGKPTLV